MNFISVLPFKKYIISFFLAFAVTLLFFSLISIVFSFFPPADWFFSILHDYSYLVSSFLAAFFCAKSSSRHGFITGLSTSAVYTAVLIFLGIVIFKSDFSAISLGKVFSLSSLTGGVGGILGINCK